jgi:FxsC-like protein
VEYDFFFSYPRAEAKIDPYLLDFYKALSNQICRLRGLDPDKVKPGFSDHDMERGTDWQQFLLRKLNESKTIVPVLMPAFYNSDDCMRELELFQSRLTNVQRQHSAVKSIFWMDGAVPMPDGLRRLQYTSGDPNDPINTKGVLYACKKGLPSYDDMIDQLARDIVKSADEQPPLPPTVGSYQRAEPRQVDPVDVAGPDHVHFVYVAASADKLPRRAAAYGGVPKAWRPFHPPTTSPIGPLTQAAAGSIEFSSDELRFDQGLLKAMRDAEDNRNLVMLIVDGWSVQLAEFDEVLGLIDKENFINAGIVVPLNENDPETAEKVNDLRDAVRGVLYRWSDSNDKLRYDDSITKLDQLKQELADKLVRLRAKVFNARRGRPTPQVPRPTLTNTGSAA